jgi:tRNA A-37 threonylcarbamoyl transferase component Bud32
MESTHADRNLLFGILALQIDFVSRDVLIAAMHAWVLQKHNSLGQILLDQQALSPDQHALLEALVQKHLALHGNNPGRSLAAISAADPVHEHLQEIADADVQASLALVPRTRPADGDPYATRAPSMTTTTSSEVRFHILRPHARGGLGELFVALDVELGREVALKQIQERHADDPASRSRFLLEAQVTGSLEHPGVVPVYGLGHYADGRPFYAMRFIKGDNLQRAIERFHQADGAATGSLELRQLLGRFLDVCQVIAYAHSRGVLHRDLKPGNIMLGQYGETLVVDWGLAKPLGRSEGEVDSDERPLTPASASGSAETLPGSAVGTPQYMSPEQAAGRFDQLGPASDVYSLGATLYCLLAGQAPFTPSPDGSLGELLQRVQRGEFPPPRRICRQVPPALEAICLKAMARKPADRYASVLALATDIERWLADEPVSAYREPWTRRIVRWTRRHRAWTTAAAVAAAAVLVTTAGAAVLLARMADQERAARITADQMRQQSVSVASRFAAKTIGNELDLRWRILEARAADPELRDLLERLQAADRPAEPKALRAWLKNQPDGKRLQAWMEARHQECFQTTQATSWILLDQEGVLLARSPASGVIGRNYAFRDYFHGQGMDLDPEATAASEPLADVHRSIVFESQATNEWMVAFSVPVWTANADARQRSVRGVLCMTVELGRFGVLQIGLGKDQVAVLVETRTDWIEGRSRQGLILHHPRLAELRLKQFRGQDGPIPVFRLDRPRVQLLEQLRRLRLRQDHERKELPWEEQLTRQQAALPGTFDANYQDPVGGDYAGRWWAAFEPVFVTGRADPIKDTGWVVIVQERVGAGFSGQE